ncbi:hypothetical protein Tco_0804242 [Tanacetum coccineum]|uniref:Synaptobrevin, longin-like domain protein n=1 Tax=Tanacetum coccineum TaxID=301880 RepID=A0ABQ5A3T2_9ASTR
MSNRHQELTSPEQTAPAMASPKQTAIGKDSSNPFMAEFCDKHNMVAYLEKSTGSAGFHPIIDFITRCHIHYALTKKPERCTTPLSSLKFSKRHTVDGHSLSITEGSIRRHLKLDDQDGLISLPTSEIFAQLALMGYVTDSDKLTFQKGAFSPQWRFLIHLILHCLSPKKTAWEQFSSNIAAAVICLATNRRFNFSRMIFDHMVSNISSPHKFLMYPRFIQLCLDMQRHKLQQHSRVYLVPSLTMKVFSNMKRSTKGFSGQEVPLFSTMLDAAESSHSPSRSTSSPSPTPTSSPTPESTHTQPSPQPSPPQPSPTQPSPTHLGSEYHPPTPHDSPLHAVHSHGSDEGSLKLQELMNLINTLSDRVGVLEADLTKTKQTYSSAYTKLILRVKKLEAQIKVGKARRHSRFVLSDTEGVEDDSSKQGRKFSNEGFKDDEGVHEKASTETELFIQEITPTEVIHEQEGSGKASDEISTAGKKKDTASEEVPPVSTAEVHISTAGGMELLLTQGECREKKRQGGYGRRKRRGYERARLQRRLTGMDPSSFRSSFLCGAQNEALIRPIFEKLWDFNQKFVPLDAEKKQEKEEVPKEPTTKRKKSIPRKTTRKRQRLEEDVEKDELKVFMDVVPREETPIEIESLISKVSLL